MSAHVSIEGAAASGLVAGTPVVGGAGDQAAGAIGAGIVEPGSLSVTLGTSGVVFAATDTYRADAEGRLHAFCHAVPGRWHLMGVTLAAAGSLQWWRDAVASDTDFAALLGEAADAPPGAERLLFLPYLSGERTPHADPDARGVFFGLSLLHRRAHLTRAVLEGVAFSLRDLLDLMAEVGAARPAKPASRAAAHRVRSGDRSSPTCWTSPSRRARRKGRRTARPCSPASAPVSGPTCPPPAEPRVPTATSPGPAMRPLYDALYERYRTLYPALAPHFAALAAV